MGPRRPGRTHLQGSGASGPDSVLQVKDLPPKAWADSLPIRIPGPSSCLSLVVPVNWGECKSADIRLDPDRLGGVITLTEGKYHQIKRMVASTGNRVVELERISFATIPLDPMLSRGEWRHLTEDEIAILRREAGELN